MTEVDILVVEEIIVVLLLIASVVAVLARRLRIPYTVRLILIGLALSLLSSTELVLGALISATDPGAVVALFRRLGVPRRLQVLLDSNS